MSLRKGNTLISGTGKDGVDGTDGFSPTASVSKSGSVSTLTVTDASGTTTTEILDGGQIIQYVTMPTASVDNLGDILQYIGTTDSTYTNGYFYQCISDGQNTPTYSWQQINVQDASKFNIVEGNYTIFTDSDINSNSTKWKNFLQNLYDNKKPFPILSISGVNNTVGMLYPSIYTVDLSTKPSQFDLVYFKINPAYSDGNYPTVRNGLYRIGLSWSGDTISGVVVQNIQGEIAKFLKLDNTKAYTPTSNYHPATKKYVDDKLTTITGYDATKTQVLTNVNGTLTWVDNS